MKNWQFIDILKIRNLYFVRIQCGDLRKDAEMDENRLNAALSDTELETVSGGIKAVDSGKGDKYLDLVETVLDCAEQDTKVKKAGIKGLKTVIHAIRSSKN